MKSGLCITMHMKKIISNNDREIGAEMIANAINTRDISPCHHVGLEKLSENHENKWKQTQYVVARSATKSHHRTGVSRSAIQCGAGALLRAVEPGVPPISL